MFKLDIDEINKDAILGERFAFLSNTINRKLNKLVKLSNGSSEVSLPESLGMIMDIVGAERVDVIILKKVVDASQFKLDVDKVYSTTKEDVIPWGLRVEELTASVYATTMQDILPDCSVIETVSPLVDFQGKLHGFMYARVELTTVVVAALLEAVACTIANSRLTGEFIRKVSEKIKNIDCDELNPNILSSAVMRAELGSNQELVRGTVLFIDVDNFKQFNDTFGHDIGDACLIKIGNVLRLIADKYEGKAYRYGGDEFVIIIKNKVNPDLVGSELVSKVKDIKVTVRSKRIFLSVTVGICYDAMNLSKAVVLADKEMLSLKSQNFRGMSRSIKYKE